MKHQSHKDRMHEREGMEHHKMGHHKMAREHGQYAHEMDKPHVPSDGHMLQGMGCAEFKGDADPIAYGQASMEGCRSDDKKIHAQMKEYHWD
jgi:hypothetical protein